MADGFGAGVQGLAQGLMLGTQMNAQEQSRKLQERQMALSTAGSVLQIAKLPKSARGPVIDHFNETLKGTGMEGIHPVVIEALKKAGDEEFGDFAKGFAGIVSGDKDLDLAATLKGATSFEGGTALLSTAFSLAKQNREQQNLEKAITSMTGGGAPAAAPGEGAAPAAAQPSATPMFSAPQITTLRALAAAGEGKEALKLAAKFQFDTNEKSPINIKFPDGKTESFLPGTPALVDAITKRKGIVERPAAVQVNVGDKMSPGVEKAIGEALDAAKTQRAMLGDLEGMEAILDSGVETGALTPLTLPVRAALKQLGIKTDDKAEEVDLLQVMQANQNQLAMRMRNPAAGLGLTGSTSDRDLTFLKDSTAGIDKTPEANKILLTTMKAKARRTAALEELRATHLSEKGFKGLPEAQKAFIDSTPLFTPDEQQTITDLSSRAKSKISTPVSAAELEEGTVVSDGKRKFKVQGGKFVPVE